jgi:Kef-type K+ transport system membrane component KefB
MFMDLGALESRVGKAVIAAALWDDVLSLFSAIVIMAVVTTLATPIALRWLWNPA